MRTVDPALHERRREQIFVAAQRVFIARGFHQTSMAELAEAAGVSMGLLYRYFSNKDDIVTQFALRERDQILARVDAFTRAPNWVDSLNELIEGSIDDAFDPELTRLNFEIVAEASRNPRLLATFSANDELVRRALADAVHSHQARGTMSRAIPASMVAEVVSALFDGLWGRALVNPAVPKTALRKAIKTFLVAALSPVRVGLTAPARNR